MPRQHEPSRGEIADWLHHPVTEWFFAELKNRIGDPDLLWRTATSWDEVRKYQGKAAVIHAIHQVCNND